MVIAISLHLYCLNHLIGNESHMMKQSMKIATQNILNFNLILTIFPNIGLRQHFHYLNFYH